MKFSTLFAMIAVCSANKQYQLFKKLNEDESLKFKPDADGNNGRLDITVGLTLQYMEYNPEEDKLLAYIWMNYEWMDKRLSWNDTETFGDSTRMKTTDIWIPDIYPYTGHMTYAMDTLAVISHTGTVLWVPPVWISTVCPFKPGNGSMPSGEQTCEFKFGSWTYSGWDINLELKNSEMDVSSFEGGKKYNLLETKATRNEVFYECCPEPYVNVGYTVTFQFKSNFIFRDGEYKGNSESFEPQHFLIILQLSFIMFCVH